MRLILVVPRFPKLSETFIVNKFVGLIDAGWDVHLVCADAGDWSDFPQLSARPELRRRVHRQWPHESAWRAALLFWPALLLALLRAPRAVTRFWRAGWRQNGLAVARRFYLDAAIIALDPQIVHFEFGAGAVGRTYLGRWLGCRLSVSFRGYDLNYAGLDDPHYYDELWQDVDSVHTLGEDLWWRALRRGCPADMPHALIPPAIDVALFRPAGDAVRAEDAPADDDRPLRILSVGRLEWKKGYEYGLAAVAQLIAGGTPAVYRIVGGGSYDEPLFFARHQMGLADAVEFLGPRPPAAVVEQMRWADVFLHPAVSEGFGNAVLEAQAMALPVVATDADGLTENVADGRSGFVVPRRDPAALAGRLAALAADPTLRQAMGQAGRERVAECFALPRQIAAFDRFYREMVSGHAR